MPRITAYGSSPASVLSAGVARTYVIFAGTILLLISSLCAPARADVGVVLNESLDTSIARITGSGHTAVYFSDICRDNPVKLRLCHEGENGSVISNYTTLGEDKPYEWNVVPLNIYLYGVENEADRPIFGSSKIKSLLEERYRTNYLTGYCESASCQTSKKAEWREMVGASLSRSIYIFVIATTPEQDQAVIDKFNAAPNVNHFNGMTRNCADFARKIVNTYFPKATKGDYINDFGMTSPKAIARSFTRYALKHPEAQFRVMHIAQVPGTLKRSTPVRTGTEQLYRSKKLLAPMLIFAAHELPAVAASYLLLGRFNPQKTWEQYPNTEASEARYQIRVAKADQQSGRVKELEAQQRRDRDKIVGTSQQWKEFHWQFNDAFRRAAEGAIIPPGTNASRTFKSLSNTANVYADPSGALWTDVPTLTGTTRVGLSASTVVAEGSDQALAYQVLLARSERILKSPKHSRETMAQFRDDWNLLQATGDQQTRSSAEAETPSEDDATAIPAEGLH